MLNCKPLSKLEVMKLAELPSREILLTMLCGTLIAPVANFVRALEQIKEQKAVTTA
jgi:ribosomal protein L10